MDGHLARGRRRAATAGGLVFVVAVAAIAALVGAWQREPSSAYGRWRDPDDAGAGLPAPR